MKIKIQMKRGTSHLFQISKFRETNFFAEYFFFVNDSSFVKGKNAYLSMYMLPLPYQ